MRKRVGMVTVLALALALAAAAGATERRFDVGDVLTVVPGRGATGWDKASIEAANPEPRLVDAVRDALPDAASGALGTATVRVDEGRWLAVDGDPADFDAVERVLAVLRETMFRKVLVRARVLRADPKLAAAVPRLRERIAAAGYTGLPLELSEADATALTRAAAMIVLAPQLTLFDGQHGWYGISSPLSYVGDLGEITSPDGRTLGLQPLLDTFSSGMALHACPFMASDGTTALELRLDMTELTGMDSVACKGGVVQKPRSTTDVFTATCAVPRGRTVLVTDAKRTTTGVAGPTAPLWLLVTAEPVDDPTPKATPATRRSQ